MSSSTVACSSSVGITVSWTSKVLFTITFPLTVGLTINSGRKFVHLARLCCHQSLLIWHDIIGTENDYVVHSE